MKKQDLLRTKPPLNPCAQTDSLCVVGSSQDSEYLSNLSRLEVLKKDRKLEFLLISLIYREGLRVSEALSITHASLLANRWIVVKGLKGSSDRLIEDAELVGLLRDLSSVGSGLFNVFDRFYVYRLFKSLNINYSSGSSSKLSVTHAGRHLLVKNMRSMGISEELIKTKMGHVKIENTGRYGH